MITATTYKEISDSINNAQELGESVAAYMTRMKTNLGNSELSDDDIHRQKVEEELDAAIDLATERQSSYTYYLLKFVEILQEYVGSNYSSVNDFLRDNGVQVGITFADISAAAGYPIDVDLIESIS